MKEELWRLLGEAPGEFRENEYWATPADSLVSGECWMVLQCSEKAIKFLTVDQTLDDPEIYRKVVVNKNRHGEWVHDSRNHSVMCAAEIVGLFFHDLHDMGQLRPHVFAGHFLYTQWMMTKLVQVSGSDFFAWLDFLEENQDRRELPYALKNYVVVIAESKGLGAALRNRFAGKELVR